MSRIFEISKAAKEYGDRTVENMRICEKLGGAVIAAFNRYLSPDHDFVTGVPPEGKWDPEREYRSAVFSSYHQRVLDLRDVEFGVAVKIPYLADKGHFWVRVTVRLHKSGDKIGVLIGGQDILWLPLEYSDADIAKVCEFLFQTILSLYREDVNLFVHGDEKLLTIGFKSG